MTNEPEQPSAENVNRPTCYGGVRVGVGAKTMRNGLEQPSGESREPNWDIAEQHLKTCESAYAEIGSSGYFALTYVIRPVRDRFNKGERTKELHDEIMEISL